MQRIVPGIIASLLLVASGYVHGMWTGRWQSDDTLVKAATKLGDVPKVLGDWELLREAEVSDEEKHVAELAGSLSRQYRNLKTGEVVSILLMVGKPGPISVHPPTACYTGLGYQQIGATRAYRCETQVNDTKKLHEFQTAQFASPHRTDTAQPRIYWAWSTNGCWVSPDSPRLAFVGVPALFKLYIAHETNSVVKTKELAPPELFLQTLLPALESSVFTFRDSY